MPLVTDWEQISPSLFNEIDLDDREAVTARTKELFDQLKAGRADQPDPVLKKAYNSTLHAALNHAAREARRATNVQKRLASESQGKKIKQDLKQKIKADAKARANATVLTDAVLAELEALGVDLTPLREKLEATDASS